ncbi:LTV1 protein [Pelomyxa schiedti]|nr:LTV1 protein [Pelomyxa schiedti]
MKLCNSESTKKKMEGTTKGGVPSARAEAVGDGERESATDPTPSEAKRAAAAHKRKLMKEKRATTRKKKDARAPPRPAPAPTSDGEGEGSGGRLSGGDDDEGGEAGSGAGGRGEGEGERRGKGGRGGKVGATGKRRKWVDKRNADVYIVTHETNRPNPVIDPGAYSKNPFELGEYGFPDDGYDYSQHFRPIGVSGGVFVSASGEVKEYRDTPSNNPHPLTLQLISSPQPTKKPAKSSKKGTPTPSSSKSATANAKVNAAQVTTTRNEIEAGNETAKSPTTPSKPGIRTELLEASEETEEIEEPEEEEAEDEETGEEPEDEGTEDEEEAEGETEATEGQNENATGVTKDEILLAKSTYILQDEHPDNYRIAPVHMMDPDVKLLLEKEGLESDEELSDSFVKELMEETEDDPWAQNIPVSLPPALSKQQQKQMRKLMAQQQAAAPPRELDEEEKVVESQFEKLLEEEYDDDDIGSLSEGEAEGDLVITPQEAKRLLADKNLKMKHRNVPVSNAPADKRAKKKILRLVAMQETAPVETEIVEVENEDAEEWDCESILSTYSTTENHPMILGEELFKAPKIKVSAKTGLPIDLALRKKPETKEEPRTEEPPPNKGTARPADETPEEKKARKAAVKEERRAKRIQKKVTQQAYKEAESAQVRSLLQSASAKSITRF